MICQTEYSFECLTSKKDSHWLWIILPIGILIVCLLYIFSRPNYARLSTRTYQLINPKKNLINLHPQKQQNDVFNQYTKYSTPTCTSSSNILFEQQKEKNNSLLSTDNTKHKTTQELNNNRYQCNEIRTPVLANYPDIIDAVETRRIHNELNLRKENHPLLPDDIQILINKGFEESNSDFNLGQIWFFLEYNPYLRELYLTIIKARHLRSMTHCQPTTFVRADILPRLNATFSTDVIQENANPDYMAETMFSINLSEFPRNVLKLTVYEIEKEVFQTSIGVIYYPLDHLLIAQRVKGHAVWRNLLPDYGNPSAIGLIQIRATVWYDIKDEYLNIYVHSLRAMGIVKQVYHVYVHVSVAINDRAVIPEEHIESPFTHEKYGPIVSFEQHNDTIYDQLFRFLIYKHEFNDMTVVLDVYRRSLGDEFFDDILLGRAVLVPPEMWTKRSQSQPVTLVKEISHKKKKKKRKKNDKSLNE